MFLIVPCAGENLSLFCRLEVLKRDLKRGQSSKESSLEWIKDKGMMLNVKDEKRMASAIFYNLFKKDSTP